MKLERNNIKPPKWGTRFFEFYCKNELSDSILGDLDEQFYLEVEKGNVFRARLRYWFNVFSFINRHTLSKPDKSLNQRHNSSAMFNHYAKITFRNLRKKAVFSSINIFGLTIGLASCMVIFFYIQREVSFDKFHTNVDQLYRVTNVYERANGSSVWVRTPPALAPAIRDNFPGIDNVTRLRYADEHTYSVNGRVFVLDHGFFAEGSFLQMFDFNLVMGDPHSALANPNSIVISQDLAKRFFGEANPLGQLIQFDNEKSLKVTGVFGKLPTNSHIEFDHLISFSTYVVPPGYLADLNSWGWGGFYTYIQIDESVNVMDLQQDISELFAQNFGRTETKVTTPLQPLKEVYLESNHYTNVGDLINMGSKSTIYALSAIAMLVLVVAGLNFMNLSTAISMSRGKEIGLRKVMGAVSGKIKIQFLFESIVIALIGMTLAIAVVLLMEPILNDLLGVALPESLSAYLNVLPLFLMATVVIGVLAGIYPSMVLSAFNPILALKGGLKGSPSGAWLRKGLTTFQFIVSVGLITISMLVVRQTNFMKDQPLGFDKENVISVNLLSDDMVNHYEALKNRFLQNPHVVDVARSSHVFDGSASSGPARLEGAAEGDSHQLAYYQTGYDFMEVMNIGLKEGRFFSKSFPTDSAVALVLNEAAVKELGLVEPIGKKVHFHNRLRTVIGVVNDFNFTSLHSSIAPMGIVMPFGIVRTALIKTRGNDIGETLTTLEDDWKSILSASPFDATFLDDDIQRMYDNEVKLAKLVSTFAILTALLAVLGLYGLVSFSVQAQLREVGIRKVLGASLKSILVLLSGQFFLLIIIANVIAWPMAYYIGTNWLSNFSYQVQVTVDLFVLPMVFLVLMAMLTLGHQVIKAAWTNPINVLRNE